MKAKTFMTLLIILGVTFLFSGISSAQVSTTVIDTISVSSAPGDSGVHTIHLTLSGLKDGSKIDSIIVLFPVGTTLPTTGQAGDTTGTLGVTISGTKEWTAITTSQTVNERWAWLGTKLWNYVDTTARPMVTIVVDSLLTANNATYTGDADILLRLPVKKNDISVADSSNYSLWNRQAGKGYIDTVVVWAGTNTANDSAKLRIESHYAPKAQRVTLINDWNATGSNPDTAGMGIAWTGASVSAKDSLIFMVVDTFGNIVIDSTNAISIQAYDVNYNFANPAGGKLGRIGSSYNILGGYNAVTQLDTLQQTLNLSTANWADGVGAAAFLGEGITYTKGTSIKIKATYTGNTSVTYTGTNTVQFVHHFPSTVTLSPSSQVSDVEVNSNTSTFTATVADSFGNVCSRDSLYLSSYRGEGEIFYGTSSSAVTTSLGQSGGNISLSSSGKAYFKMLVGTVATTSSLKDTLIIQAKQWRGNVISTPALNNTNLRKAIDINIVAGEVANVVLYPTVSSLTSGDLTDQVPADYYEGTYGSTGRVRAGSAITFVAKLTDQFGNAKAVTQTFLNGDSVTWSVGSKSTVGGSFNDTNNRGYVSTTTTNFTVAVDTVVYTTSTTVDTDTVTVTVKLPSGETRTSTAPFYTKGGEPAKFKWIVASGDTLNGYTYSGTPTDTVDVDSVIHIQTVAWDTYGNIADSFRTITFQKGFSSVVTGNAGNDGFSNSGTHTLSGSSTDTDSLNEGVAGTTYNMRTAYGNTYFNTDSSKGYAYVVVAVGSAKKDSIKLMKHPSKVNSVVLKILEGTTEMDHDVAVGTIISGSNRYLRIRFYDKYNNFITPASDTTLNGDYHPGALFGNAGSWSSRVAIDTLIKVRPKGGDSSKVASIGAVTGDSSVTGAYDMLATGTSNYLKYTLRTQGGRADSGAVRVAWIGQKDNTITPADTAFFRTTLPDVLSFFAAWVSAPTGTITQHDVNVDYTITLAPKDVGGNPIYALGVTKLELSLISSADAVLTFDTTKGALGAPIQDITWSGNSDLSMKDSISGMVFTKTWTDSLIDDSAFTINVKSTKVLSDVKVKLVSTTANTTGDIDSIYNFGIDWDAGAVDTIDVSLPGGATTVYEHTMFDLGIAFKDAFKNRMADSTYMINVRADNSNVTGIGSGIVVTDSAALKVTVEKADYPSGITFYAQATQNPVNGNAVSVIGYTGNYTVSSATIGAPASLDATNYGTGGYVQLAFTRSANHPGMTGTADDNLPIDYYQIYREETTGTPSIANATAWAAVIATPMATGETSTVKYVVSTKGDLDAAYYWVAAVAGDLPAELSGSDGSATKVMEGVKVATLINSDAKPVADINYAVMGSDGRMISAVSNANLATAVSAAQAAKGDYNGNNSVDLSDMVLILSVFGVSSEYDAVFDLDNDGDVDLSDIVTVLANYGTTLSKEVIAPKVGAANIDHKINANGDMINMSVSLENIENVNGYGFIITYDPADYKFVDGRNGDFNGFFATSDKPGRLVVMNILKEGTSGAGTAANLTFQWISEDVSPMTIRDIATMSDGDIFSAESKVIESPIAVPKVYALHQNYPNPFNPETTVKFDLPKSSDVRLEVYNILGQKVKTLVNNNMKVGYHKIKWNGRNDYGVKVSSGIYIYVIKAGEFVAKQKMTLIK